MNAKTGEGKNRLHLNQRIGGIMKTKRNRWLLTVYMAAGLAFAAFLFFTGHLLAADEGAAVEIKGQVSAVSKKAKTISVSVEGKGVVLVKFNDETEFKAFKDLKEIDPPTAVVVKYKTVGEDKVATYVEKAFAKLPPGVEEIKTAELAALVAKGPSAGNYLLVDSRPAPVAAAGHIPTAVLIPVTALEKEGEKLLTAEKSKMLIFYCGGPT
jgi:hypothetical protein